MAKVKLDKMSLEDLKSLEKDVAKAITNFEKKRVAEAKKAVEAVAKKHGVSLTDLVGTLRKPRATKAQKAAPKYANPSNKSETWSGRGRQPAWYKEAIAAGKTKESMAI